MPWDGTNYGGAGSGSQNWADYQYQMNNQGSFGGNSGSDLARGIFGGPVGWAEIGQGKSFLGGMDPFSRTTLSHGMTEDVYNTMTPAEWKAFSQMNGQEQASFIQSRTSELGPMKEAQAANKKAQDQEAAYQTWRSQVMGQLQTFANKMNMSVDQLIKSGDAGAALAQQTGQRAAGQQSVAAGMSGAGGLSNLNTQKVVQDSLNNYAFQRQQVGAQTLNNLQQGLGSMAHDQQSINEYNQGLSLQLQQARNAQYMQQYAQGQGQASAIGGAIGSIWGPVGQKVGAGLGGVAYGSQNPYQAPGYSYPSAGGLTGGGGTGGTAYNPNGQ